MRKGVYFRAGEILGNICMFMVLFAFVTAITTASVIVVIKCLEILGGFFYG